MRPYAIPANWIWTRLKNVVTVSKDKYSEFNGSDSIKYIGLEHMRKNAGIIGYGDASSVYSIKKIFKKDNLLYGRLRPYLNKHDVVDFDGICSTDILVFKALPHTTGKYVNYYMDTKKFIDYAVNNSKGISLPRVSQGAILDAAIPIPPLSEQHRIVERIESLFYRLDRAKELTQTALDGFETRKAAILNKAFTGELTAKWRKENGIELKSWQEKPLSELCDSFQYGTLKKSQPSGRMSVIRTGNLQNGEINWDNLVYSNDETDNEKYKLSEGDVLFNRTNSPALVGKTSVYRGDKPAIFAGYLIRIIYKDCLDGYYLNYIMNSQRAKEYCSSVKSDSVNLSNINAKKLAAFIVPLPTLAEQREIVLILDGLFEKERRAFELYNVIDKIDLLKKAILVNAFRGELGTNDPSERANAIGLSGDVLSQEAADEA